ncbi:MAG: glycoside hydrolase family 32 protein, partial [Oscillospiraceae bacterium]|nr:glycoside hydrolase family 32 protein [Oscillospiraceae bacterium]
MAVKPIYHLQPESNWMNDPNGPCFIGGLFHMFYQHNPCEAVWGNMTWGHAVSPDMVHWRRLPHALHPDMPYDKDGVFSGCCVVRDGTPHILYTGVFPEKLCLAVGDAGGEAFIKHEGNPILTRGDRELAGWRDPYVWRQGDTYNMLIGSGDSSGGFAESY